MEAEAWRPRYQAQPARASAVLRLGVHWRMWTWCRFAGSARPADV